MLFFLECFFSKNPGIRHISGTSFTLFKIFVCGYWILFLTGCANTNSDPNKDFAFFSITENSKESNAAIIPDTLTPKEYINWFKENEQKLKAKKDTADYSFVCQYRPAELEALNYLQTEESISSLDSILKIKKNYLYFLFSIKPLSGKSLQNLKDNFPAQYSLFDIQKDFKLISSKDTLTCSMFIPMNESFHINGEIQYYLAFDSEKAGGMPKNDLTLYFKDQMLTHSDIIFPFYKDILRGNPHLTN